MNYVYAILGLVAGFFTARTFFKAGSFKRTASKEALLGAQIGWVANVPMGFVRIVGWLEILGAIGVVAAPVFAYVTGLGWAQILGVAAGAGITAIMMVAIFIHAARKETKYTLKMNTTLGLIALAAAVFQALVTLPLF
jgi:hypothetical protein